MTGLAVCEIHPDPNAEARLELNSAIGLDCAVVGVGWFIRRPMEVGPAWQLL